jgi:hypothetical protein
VSTTGVRYDPWARAASRELPRPLELYRRAVAYKANPRSREYMETLFASTVAGGRLVEAEPTPSSLADADRVVLLYPDAIGVGFGRLERRVLAQVPAGAKLWALNGRRRLFELTPKTRRRLALRRLLEVSMLPEAVVTVLFAAASVPLALIDLLRGRR